MKGLLSLYSPRYAAVLVYMLQSTEYEAGPYLRWYWRVRDFNQVRQRRDLVRTRAARLLQNLGFEATALLGGYEAWKSRYPVEPADRRGAA